MDPRRIDKADRCADQGFLVLQGLDRTNRQIFRDQREQFRFDNGFSGDNSIDRLVQMFRQSPDSAFCPFGTIKREI